MTSQVQRTAWMRTGVLPDPSNVAGLIEQVSDIAVFLSADFVVDGISVSSDSPSLGCLDHWVGRKFESFLTEESQVKFARRVAELRVDPGLTPRAIELNHVDNATWEFPVRYSMHAVDDGAILLVGRDMQPIAEVQQRLLNEQLARERDLQRLRGEETFYRVVLEASETAMVLVEPKQGRIRDLNSAAAGMLGSKPETLSGSSFAQVFEGRRREELMDALQASATSEEASAVELVARRNGRTLQVFPRYFRASGDLYLLCRVVSVGDEDEADSQVARALAGLFTSSSDAIVLTDSKGVIRDANEAFLVMTDAAQLMNVKDELLSEYLVRGSVDLKLILEAAAKSERLRSYSTQIVSLVGMRTTVDISAAQLRHRGGDVGFGLIIRDVTSAEQPDSDTGMAVMSEDAMRNVMDLVGTASLKELVSATSDVVEKMCIETAVQLTSNNRVAAAEMLGLSRQSLYVKLRKHGFIDDSSDTSSDE